MNDNTANLRIRPKREGVTVMDLFRQLVAQGKIKFNFGLLTVEPKAHDLERIHDIIHEIDDRRVFYNAFEDELPEYMVRSVREAKAAIHADRKGVWADLWARQVVQKILDDLGQFLTRSESIDLPRNHHAANFDEFADSAAEMRLRVWSAVAELVVAFGEAVHPMHLPEDLREEVRAIYDDHASK